MSRVEEAVKQKIMVETRRELRALMDAAGLAAYKLMEHRGPWDTGHKFMYLWWCAMILDGTVKTDGFYAKKRELANALIWDEAIDRKLQAVVEAETNRVLADRERASDE